MISTALRESIRKRLADEVGRREKDAPCRVALGYPSPYAVGMSSLGYQRIYGAIQDAPGLTCERVFLEDGGDRAGSALSGPPVSYETLRPLDDFRILAFSVAYEGELAGLVKMLDAASIPAFREERNDDDAFILGGGPLTFSNPTPLGAFADAVIIGEAEEVVTWALEIIDGAATREEACGALAKHPHIYVPALHGEVIPPVCACDDALLPATSVIRTPNTELSNMFLIEVERGCSRGCRYCVMRRSTNGGMRIVPKDVILDAVPAEAERVGLVGAAVSDHPKIIEIVRELSERGYGVGLSSLRPDRLKEEFVATLKAAGYRTLTTALDGLSEKMRAVADRRGHEKHFVAAAEHARKVGMDRLKLYLMVGLPGEEDADVDECVAFVSGLSRIVPIALGIAPFCPKRNTPLDAQPFAGVSVVDERLDRLRRGLKGRADVRSTSAKWAWVEYVLAQGGLAEGRAVADAVRAGGRFAQYRAAFGALGHEPNGGGKREGSKRKLVLSR